MNNKSLANAIIALALCCNSTSLFAQESKLPAVENTQSIIVESKVNAVSKNTLMAKLSKLHFFTANFAQQVLSESGDLIEESTGQLAISKPNLANWQVLTPDELTIVSDGTSVWFYNPWIEQVSVYSLSAAIARTPILLLTSKDETLWQQYMVEQKESQNKQEIFVINAIDSNSQIKSLTLIFETIERESKLSEFSFLDATGQLSHIKLSAFNDQQAPNLELFNFIAPEGTQVDDQR